MQLGLKNKKLIVDLSSFVTAVITLAIVFGLTFISVFGILSLKDYQTEKENSNQIVVYLNNIDEEQKTQISKDLLELPAVNSLRYESKELALKGVMLEFGINLPENENPLDDAFYVYLKKDVNLEKLKDSLVNMKGISAFDFRTKAIEEAINFNDSAEQVVINSAIIVSVLTVLMIYNIIKFSIISKKNEIHESLHSGSTIRELKKIFFTENVVAILLSFVIALVLYLYLKIIIVDSINSLVFNFKTDSFSLTEGVVLLIILVISILISFFINYIFMDKYFKSYTGDVDLEKFENEVVEIEEKIINKEEFENEMEEVENEY